MRPTAAVMSFTPSPTRIAKMQRPLFAFSRLPGARFADARLGVVLVLALIGSGCASLIGQATSRLAEDLGRAVLNADDPATVRDGLPAYLLLLDGLLEGNPDNVGTLLAAAQLNAAYAGNFTGTDSARGQRLSARALAYAQRATCLEARTLCAALDGNPHDFAQVLAKLDDRHVGLMYVLAAAWAGQIQAHRDDWAAVADLPKVEALLQRVVAIDPAHAGGLPLVYLGVLNSLRPEAVGGRPAQGRAYFQQAIDLSAGRNLYAKTLMAEFHARLVFDRELHDRLLREVLAGDPRAPGFTLMNTLAQQRAKALLASGQDYF